MKSTVIKSTVDSWLPVISPNSGRDYLTVSHSLVTRKCVTKFAMIHTMKKATEPLLLSKDGMFGQLSAS